MSSRVEPENTPMTIELPEDDVADIHGKLSSALQSLGLTGHALDVAVSQCFRATVKVVQRERTIAEQRRDTLHAVE